MLANINYHGRFSTVEEKQICGELVLHSARYKEQVFVSNLAVYSSAYCRHALFPTQ